ncbi:sugar O-acetyltransferase [Citrobacter freundii]|uniref:sugar O-acetyltransferase n=1 Tax=Citrobacter freundii TaxID=546 RepID=UPI003AAEC215
MFTYLRSILSKKIKVATARNLINTRPLTRKKRNCILMKTGIILTGECAVTPPFYYEFGRITIGSHVYINAGCVFLDQAPISIGDNTLIGPNTTITTASHPVNPSQRSAGVIAGPISIGSNVWLGAGVVVLPGVTIGNNSVIAANSVVRTDVPADCLFAGVPATFKKNI